MGSAAQGLESHQKYRPLLTEMKNNTEIERKERETRENMDEEKTNIMDETASHSLVSVTWFYLYFCLYVLEVAIIFQNRSSLHERDQYFEWFHPLSLYFCLSFSLLDLVESGEYKAASVHECVWTACVPLSFHLLLNQTVVNTQTLSLTHTNTARQCSAEIFSGRS